MAKITFSLGYWLEVAGQFKSRPPRKTPLEKSRGVLAI